MGKLIKAATLGIVDDPFGTEGAQRAAEAGQLRALDSQERMQERQHDFLKEQQGVMRGDVLTYEHKQLGQLANVEKRLREAGAADEARRFELADRTAGGQQDFLQKGLSSLGQRFDQAQGALDPYSRLGASLAGSMSFGGGVDLASDPGYQFRLQEGEKALQRQQSAMGIGMSGRAMKEMARYSQGLASQEYAAAFGRQARTRDQQLQALGMGASAAGQQASMYGAQAGLEQAGYGALAGTVPQYAGMMSPTQATIQDPTGILAGSLGHLTGLGSQYTSSVNQSLASLGASQAQAHQNLGAIGAQAATADFQNVMSLGQLAAGVMTGAGGVMKGMAAMKGYV